MKKIKKLSLDKKTIARLENNQMSHLMGKGVYLSDVYLPDSQNTAFTAPSCCGGTCAAKTCHANIC